MVNSRFHEKTTGLLVLLHNKAKPPRRELEGDIKKILRKLTPKGIHGQEPYIRHQWHATDGKASVQWTGMVNRSIP